ncbi:MAG TPA: hypothetical protein VNR61_13560 [Niallia sp.]|nr:hypothetical protein [Niallia sp.]
MLGVLENSFINYLSKYEVEMYELEPFGEDEYEVMIELQMLGSDFFNAKYTVNTDEEIIGEGVTCQRTREEALLLAENQILKFIKRHKNNK